MITVYVPRDSSALALGADEIALKILDWAQKHQITLNLVRNGSRGMLWLEPLIELETTNGRIGYGSIEPENIEALLEAGLLNAAKLPCSIDLVEEHPYLKKQERLTFARIGLTDPLSLEDYAKHGGWIGLQAARHLTQQEIVKAVTDSGLRGRGGAAFPAGIKWNTVLAQNTAQKYIVCNADEGDSGTFSDRLIMESDPYTLIEGMAIAGLAVGANRGYIYVRSEYPHAIDVLNEAILRAEAAGYLENFRCFVRKAAGAYICGEETALLESLEGKRGVVRAKPPLPAIEGLFGKPTVINNVITLASVPIVLARGAQFYQDYGMGRSRGTMPFQLAGNIAQGGLVEKAFGVTLRELVMDFGAGTFTGASIKAIQVGGPLGSYVPEEQWDTPLDYEAYTAIGAVVGHGGIVVHDTSTNMRQLARYAMEFCAIESCGKCTPCRIGSVRGVEVLDKMAKEPANPQHEELLRDLCDTMLNASLCAMGGMTPYPVLSALKYYPDDFKNAT